MDTVAPDLHDVPSALERAQQLHLPANDPDDDSDDIGCFYPIVYFQLPLAILLAGYLFFR